MKKIFQFNSLDPSKTRNTVRVHKANHSLRAFVEHEMICTKPPDHLLKKTSILERKKTCGSE